MTVDVVVDIIRAALVVVVKASIPMLAVSLVVGLIISVLQTITSVQEQTLTFVPKLFAIFAILALCGQFIFGTIIDYTEELFSNFGMYIK